MVQVENLLQNIRKAAPLVLRAMIDNKKTRDDDNLLCVCVWRLQGASNEIPFGDFARLLMEGTLSTPETLTRTRRKIQEQRVDLRGKLYNVRRKVEEEMKNQLKFDFNFEEMEMATGHP